ncbi:unnamed protein product, partial [Owenia fusiformis]
GPLYIVSKNKPAHDFGLDSNGRGILMRGGDLFYILSPGLNFQKGTISFESVELPGSFLRNSGGKIKLEEFSSVPSFLHSATFWERENQFFSNYTAYESVENPGFYIRHSANSLVLEEFSGRHVFTEDASFWNVI